MIYFLDKVNYKTLLRTEVIKDFYFFSFFLTFLNLQKNKQVLVLELILFPITLYHLAISSIFMALNMNCILMTHHPSKKNPWLLSLSRLSHLDQQEILIDPIFRTHLKS